MTEDEINETQFGGVRVEIPVRTAFNAMKKLKFEEGCAVLSNKKRIADYFLMGICRAYYKEVLPKKLIEKKKDKPNVFNISPVDSGEKKRTLTDKADFWNIFRIIAYVKNIKDAGNDKDSDQWQNSHNILMNGTECTRIVQELFKGGWSLPLDDSYKDFSNSQNPDDIICDDLGFAGQDVILLQEDAEEEEGEEMVDE